MNLSDFIPTSDQFASIQGIERKLLERRHASILSAAFAILLAVVQLVLVLANKVTLPPVEKLLSWHGIGKFLHSPEGLLLLGLFMAASIFLIVRYTGFLFKEFKEPFRYTFSIRAFDCVTAAPSTQFSLANDHLLKLLHFDLTERLNRRIRRLSFLEDTPRQADASGKPDDRDLRAHIHVEGDYAIREEDDDDHWTLHVWPRVRIGSLNNPFASAFPLRFVLEDEPEQPLVEGEAKNQDQAEQTRELKVEQYGHLVERVYSSVATEIYKQIQADVDSKMHLFPTSSLRALARFYEARDFEDSHTIDAYDHALELYKTSQEELDGSGWHQFQIWLSRRRWFWPLFWIWRPELQIEAKTRLGYSRCLIYRRLLSEISGRKCNALFEVREQMKRARDLLEMCYDSVMARKDLKFTLNQPDTEYGETNDRLDSEDQSQKATGALAPLNQSSLGEKPPPKPLGSAEAGYDKPCKGLLANLTFPDNSPFPPWHRRRKQLYRALREELCEAYAVSALGHLQLADHGQAKEFISIAEALGANQDANRTLVFLAKAEIEPILSQRKVYLNRAKEISPEFDIVLYRLAVLSDYSTRHREAITPETVNDLANNYGAVLKVNPGCIASLIGQGYLFWLVADLDRANKAFKGGIELQKIVSQTFVGDLQYGLARVAAERAAKLLLKNSNPNLISEEQLAQEARSRTDAAGLLHQAVHCYEDAIAADPAVAAGYLASTKVLNSYYVLSWKEMVERYERVASLLADARRTAEAINIKATGEMLPIEAFDTLLSYAWNDYGNASLNYYLRHELESNQTEHIDIAVSRLEEAVRRKDSNFVTRYNLAVANTWSRKSVDEENQRKLFSEVVMHFPGWLEPARTECLWQLEYQKSEISKIKEKIKRLTEAGKKNAEHSPEPLNEASLAAVSRGSSPRPEDKSAPSVSLNETVQQDVGPLNENLKDLQEERFEKLKDFLQLVVRDNQLYPLKEYLLPITRQGLDKLKNLLEQRDKNPAHVWWRKEEIVMDWSRFGEEEVFALAAWAQLLACIDDQPLLINASRLLCKHILRVYYNNYFDILSALITLTQDDNELSDLKQTVFKLLEWSGKSDPHSRFYSKQTLDLVASYTPSPENKDKNKFVVAIEAYNKARTACEKLPRFHYELSLLLQGQQRLCENSDGKAIDKTGQILKESQMAYDLDRENAEYREHLFSVKRDQWIRNQGLEDTLNAVPSAYLIRVEVAKESVEELALAGPRLPSGLQEKVAELRKKLTDEIGFILPGVNFQDNSIIERGQYRCLVRDVQLPLKTLPSGDQSTKWNSLTKELERVAREHVADFYGLQDVATALKQLEPQEGNETEVAEYRKIQELQEKPESLSALTLVLKSLLREQVPLTEFKLIVAKFLSCSSLEMPLVDIGEEIRSIPEIKVRLSGNRPETPLLMRLAPETEAQVSACLDRAWIEPVLDPGEEIEALLTWSGHQLLKMADGEEAAFVTSEAIRPFVRRLANATVPVLSSREVLPVLIPRIEDERVLKQNSSHAEAAG